MAGIKLIVTLSTGEGGTLSEHAFDKDAVTLGRTIGNDIVLPDVEKRVSSKHARLDRRGGAWFLTDLGSTNGTYLNDKKIEGNQPVPIKTGDRLGLGVFQLRFVQEEEQVDQTIVHVDPARQAARLAEEACLVYARHSGSPPEARLQAVKDLLKSSLAGTPKETARAVCAQVRSRFESSAQKPDVAEKGTMLRKRDAQIVRQEELYLAGYKAINALSQHFLGEGGFEKAEQVERFCALIEQTLNIMLEWLANALKGRREFENQFSADLTMVFSKEGNPLKTAAAPPDMGRFLLDWRAARETGATKAQLEAAFKDLTMHQLGMLAGVQDALKAALTRLDPKMIEQQAAGGGVFAKLNATKRAWEIYTAKHKEMFEENSKLFNEVIYPNIRKGYLASHAGGEPGSGPDPSGRPIAQL